jgi:pimeloyl-ACP methyl ester carboxylesterase
MLSSYRRDMQRAWNRIRGVPTRRLQTRFGTVEYAERGEGLPILNCHGVLGCHVDGVGGWWTNMLGESFRVISPSRFGYFGSTLQPAATPADQADAYALLLDHLDIDRAAIIAYSAGSASVLEFALRHSDRAIVLILANARLGGSTPNKLLKPILGAVYGSEWLFWADRALCRRSTAGWWACPGATSRPPTTWTRSEPSATCSSPSRPARPVPSSTGSCPTRSPTGSPWNS